MDTPFVCNTNVLSATQKERYKELTRKLNDYRQAIKELSDGYAFRFKADSQLIQDAQNLLFTNACAAHFSILNWQSKQIQTGFG
jgi:hypothetical protein